MNYFTIEIFLIALSDNFIPIALLTTQTFESYVVYFYSPIMTFTNQFLCTDKTCKWFKHSNNLHENICTFLKMSESISKCHKTFCFASFPVRTLRNAKKNKISSVSLMETHRTFQIIITNCHKFQRFN